MFSIRSFQAILEKLLRSCPDVRNIYVLMRTKRGTPVHDRLQKILSEPVSVIHGVWQMLGTMSLRGWESLVGSGRQIPMCSESLLEVHGTSNSLSAVH